MQLVDRNGVFKNRNTLKHEYDLQNNLYFLWMQPTSAIPSNWKNIIKQNNNINTFTTTQHHLFETQESLLFKKQLQRNFIGYLPQQLSISQPHKNTLKKNSLN